MRFSVLAWLALAATTLASPAEDVTAAMELPRSAKALRTAGVDAAELKNALKAMREKGVPAAHARKVLDDSATAAKEHGPIDNFGGFVQEKLESGLRGKDLSDAIKKEHAKRGGGGKGGKAKSKAGDPDDKGKGKAKAPEGKVGKGKGGKAGEKAAPDAPSKAKGKAP